MKTLEVRAFLEDELKKYMTPEAQTFTLQTWYKYMFPYIPFVTGALASTMDIADTKTIKFSTDEAMQMGLEGIKQSIHFKVPYATRMYYGMDFHFTKDQHPLAQARWAETALDLHWEQIKRELKDHINKGVK